ncbi:hypothetical protein M8C21_005290, partial [Ambrosia artemisiifolia]
MGKIDDKEKPPSGSVAHDDAASESSCYATDEEDTQIQLGPKISIKEHLEKDKDDESLRRWKEQLLGSVDVSQVEEVQEPDVKILSLTIISADRPDIVSNDIVCGLRYTNHVWKTGLKVDNSKEMLGTFSPQPEPYTHIMPEEVTPSGFLARGNYSAKT